MKNIQAKKKELILKHTKQYNKTRNEKVGIATSGITQGLD